MRSSFLIRTALISFLSLLAASSSDLLAQGTLIQLTTRRDMVFDHVGKYLYISTSTTPTTLGQVKRYNLATGRLDTDPIYSDPVGGLNGIDISADDSFLLVAEDATLGVAQGGFQEIILFNNSVAPIRYDRKPGETGAWDVAIDWENRALVTTQDDGTSQTPVTPVRQILANNQIIPRPEAPGSGGGGLVGSNTQIYRSADRTRFYFLESNVATGPIFTYDAIADAFGSPGIANALLNSADGGVNRDGTLLGTRLANGSLSLDTAPDFTFVHSFPDIDHGVAFNAVQDIVYGGNSTTDEIVGYDTQTPFAEKFRREIGEDVPNFRDNNCTTLVASQDGRYLALATASGIRLLPTVVTGTANLANISTRVAVLTGNNILIGGFIIAGTDPKRVAIRALGPSLINAGVPNPLHDPILELSDGNGIIGINDDWQSASNAGDIPPDLRPSDSHESVILTTLQPGSYTVSVRGNGNTGVGLFEVYDLDISDTTVNSRLANVSSRGFVQTGGDILIAGIIAQGGDGISQVVIRAIGPSLAASGINNALANPTLELHDGNGELIRSNDNWKSTQQSALEATGLAPSNDLESAILVTLTAGNYTAIVTGFGEPIGSSSPDASLPVNASVTRIQAGDYPSHLGEKQHIHFSSIPIAGSFKLTFPGPGPGVPTGQCVSPIGTTAAIPVTATNAQIQAAIDALPVAVYHTGAVHVASWGHYDLITGTTGDFTIDYHALCAGTAPYDFGGFLNLCSIETIGVQSATGVGLVEIYDLE
jgi:hypothetical protein